MLYKTSSLTHLSSGSELQRRGMMEVLNYMHTDRKDECEVQQVARTGFQNAERLIQILAQHHSNQQPLQQDCSSAAFEAITSFKKVASLLSRTGHARFRRGPEGVHSSMASFGASFVEAPNFCQPDTTITFNQSSSSASPPSPPQRTSSQVASPAVSGGRIEAKSQQTQQRSNPEMAVVPSFSMDTSGCTAPISSSRSFMSISSMNVEGSVSNGKSLLQQQALPPVWPRPSNSAGVKRKCSGKPEDLSGKCASLGKCHCSKRRKLRLKRTIKVPAISNKLAEIPPDEYSWRKYGQKPIKGSPHPRGYYKCSSMRGCPARKHVERSLDDPTMLTVTYEGEHNHTRTSTAPNSNAMIVHNYEADGNAKPIPTSRALTAANGSIGVNNYEAEHGNAKSISPSNNSSTVVLHS